VGAHPAALPASHTHVTDPHTRVVRITHTATFRAPLLPIHPREVHALSLQPFDRGVLQRKAHRRAVADTEGDGGVVPRSQPQQRRHRGERLLCRRDALGVVQVDGHAQPACLELRQRRGGEREQVAVERVARPGLGLGLGLGFGLGLGLGFGVEVHQPGLVWKFISSTMTSNGSSRLCHRQPSDQLNTH
jgi:hypothetical protein